MSSQIFIRYSLVVLNTLLFLRWGFLFASGFALYQCYSNATTLNIIIFLVFLYYLGQFYVLEVVYFRSIVKPYKDEIDKYNKTVEEINSKSQNTRRAIIRNLQK